MPSAGSATHRLIAAAVRTGQPLHGLVALGDREPAMLAAFLTFAESMPTPFAASAVPSASEPESLRNSTPEERLSFFGKG